MQTALWAPRRLACLPVCSGSVQEVLRPSGLARPAATLPSSHSTRPAVRHQTLYGESAEQKDKLQLPDTLIVVEGLADKAAVQRVVHSKVLSCPDSAFVASILLVFPAG